MAGERAEFFAADSPEREAAPLLLLTRHLFLGVALSLGIPLGLAAFLGLLAATLFGNLGDEETLLTNLGLGFLFGVGFDGVLHLEARVVHRFILKSRHNPSPVYYAALRQFQTAILPHRGSRRIARFSVFNFKTR